MAHAVDFARDRWPRGASGRAAADELAMRVRQAKVERYAFLDSPQVKTDVPAAQGTKPDLPTWKDEPPEKMTAGRRLPGAPGAAFGMGMYGLSQALRPYGLEALMRRDVARLSREHDIPLDVDHNPAHRAIAEEYTQNRGDSELARLYRAPMSSEQALDVVRQRLGALERMKEEPPAATEAGGSGQKTPPSGGGVRSDGDCDDWAISQSPRTRLPKKHGRWDGEPGNSNWYSTRPEVNAITGGQPIRFTDGRPNFTPWARMSINVEKGIFTGVHHADVKATIKQMASHFGSEEAASQYIRENILTPHHASDTCMQLVPRDLNRLVPHFGSASGLRASSSED